MERKMKDTGIEWIGKIPEGWAVLPTKVLFEIYAGSTPDTDNSNYWGGDIPWVTPVDFKTQDVYIRDGHNSLTKAGLQSCSVKCLPAGALIFSKRAPIGQVVISAKPMCTNQGCFSCRIKNDNDVKFFYYQASVFQPIYEMFGAGTTFKEISGFNFSNFKLVRPPFEEQERIVSFLDSRCSKIDSMILKQRQAVETLKKYKKSLIYEYVTGKKRVEE